MKILGLDIGGANIKAATADGLCVSVHFEIWKSPELLAETLTSKIAAFTGKADLVAVTMTAELADCFDTRTEGVTFIIRSVQQAFADSLIRIWLTSGEFAEPEDACDLPMLAAASNWNALATWAGRAFPNGPAILLDIGSTTTDIIPLLDGFCIAQGTTDLTRLQNSELLYTGASRTPVCTVVRRMPIEQQLIPIAAEHFSTMLDVHVITGGIPEQPDRFETADGRPADREHALRRFARMACSDPEELTELQLVEAAEYLRDAQAEQIAEAVQSQLLRLSAALSQSRAESQSHAEDLRQRSDLDSPDTIRTLKDLSFGVLLCGSGSFIGRLVLEALRPGDATTVLDLSLMYNGRVSAAACAFAVARLAAERCLDDMLPNSGFL